MDQGVKESNKINSIFCYIISFGFLKGTSFLLIPIYANYLTKSEYGYFIFLITILSFLSLISDLGLNNALYRYIKNKRSDSLILGSVVIVSFFMNLILSVSFLFLISNFNFFAYVIDFKHMLILCISLTLSSFTMLNLTYLRVVNKSFNYMLISVLQPIIHLCIFSVLIFLDKVNVGNILYSTLIANTTTATFVYLKNYYNFTLVLRLNLIKKILRYTVGTMVSILALYVLTGLDKLYLSYYVSVEDLADYSLIILFASITILIVEPISLWYFANRFNLLKEKNKFEIITSNLVIFNLWIAIFLIINIPIVYEKILPSNYNFNELIFILAVLSFHLKYLSTILNIGCYIKKTTNIVAKINMFSAFLTFICYFLLVEKFETIGLLFSISIGYFSILALNMHCSNKEIKIMYKKNRIFLNYIVSTFIITIFLNIEISFIFQNVIAISIIILINKKGFDNVKCNLYKRTNKNFKKTAL